MSITWRVCPNCAQKFPAVYADAIYCTQRCKGTTNCRRWRWRRYNRGYTRDWRTGAWRAPQAREA